MPELILRPDLGKRAYRLRCRFRIGAYPKPEFLQRAKVEAAEQFIRDLAKQGWEYVDKFGFKMSGPFVAIDAQTIRRERVPTAREMLPAVMQGARFLPKPIDGLQTLPHVSMVDKWEFELAGVFVHETLLMEGVDEDEEKEALKKR